LNEIESFLSPIKALHETIRQSVVEVCERSSIDHLASVVADAEGDTIFAIDRVSEELLLDFFDREVAQHVPIVLIAEGLAGGSVVLPSGAKEVDARWRIIVDPIDGTRGLMYQKRSAWILTGVAPNRGSGTNLGDIEFAIQTEIPLVKQHLSDMIWAFRGHGAKAERHNRINNEVAALRITPSSSPTIEQGFATVARFFPGVRDVLAEIDEEMTCSALGPPRQGKAQSFEDQYISTGGQLYELIAGHDRFIADLRPLVQPMVEARGFDLSICCHPYDLCTELIARESGVVITNEFGHAQSAPLNVDADVAWVGYANDSIRKQVEPHLNAALKKRGLLPS